MVIAHLKMEQFIEKTINKERRTRIAQISSAYNGNKYFTIIHRYVFPLLSYHSLTRYVAHLPNYLRNQCFKLTADSSFTDSSVNHCLKRVQIRSIFWFVFSCIWTEYEPEKTPYLETFHALNLIVFEKWIKNKLCNYFNTLADIIASEEITPKRFDKGLKTNEQ